jgi:hypothetical protein
VGDRTRTGDIQIHSLNASGRKGKVSKGVGETVVLPLAQTLAREPQKYPTEAPDATPSTLPPAEPFDLAGAVAALAKLPEADRLEKLDALARALMPLPLAERAHLAGRLLDGR